MRLAKGFERFFPVNLADILATGASPPLALAEEDRSESSLAHLGDSLAL
jgi:hypothetical protein